MDNLTEVNNIVSYVRRRFFTSSERQLIQTLRSHADDVCRQRISTEYIHSAFNRFKQGFAYYDEQDMLQGFCIWRPKIHIAIATDDGEYTKTHSKAIYIELLCAKQVDYLFLNRVLPDVEKYCVEHGIKFIELVPSTERVRQLYQSYGFIVSNTDTLQMVKQLLPVYYRSKKTRKGPRHEYKFPTDWDPEPGIRRNTEFYKRQKAEAELAAANALTNPVISTQVSV